MKQKTTPYIYILFLVVFCNGIYSQNLTLRITSKNKSENKILNKLNYIQKHKDLKSLKKETTKISNHLKNIGYFTHKIDSFKKLNSFYTVFFDLNKKTKKAIIEFSKKTKSYTNLKLNEDYILEIPINQLQTLLNDISTSLDNNGKSFSKVQLKNINIKGENLYGEIQIKESKKRTLDKIIIKNYRDFPNNFIKNYFNLNDNSLINKKKVKQIHNISKNLGFINVIKPPEILFLKDSTLLYMYFKKKQHNYFDGIVNFNSNENGNLIFNGNLKLSLSNILNKGEKFNLNWINSENKQQALEVSTEIPYIFNSKLSPNLNFSIFKQDSTFINTKFKALLNYNINTKSKLALTFDSENSEKLTNTDNLNIETFKSIFLGFKYTFKVPKKDFFNNNEINVEIQSSIGKRNIENKSTNQIKINSNSSYIFKLNSSNEIYIQNSIGYLNSNNYINNELFRIGGFKTIRGIGQFKILANHYNLINLEFRHLPSISSYFYTITDVGYAKIGSKNKNFLSLGFGYLFSAKKSIINLSLSTETKNNQNSGIKKLTLNINWVNNF